MCEAPVPLASHHRPHGPANCARVTQGYLSHSTWHALSLLSATSAHKNSAEAHVQLKEKNIAKPFVVASLHKHHVQEACNGRIRPRKSANNRAMAPRSSRQVTRSIAKTFSKP